MPGSAASRARFGGWSWGRIAAGGSRGEAAGGKSRLGVAVCVSRVAVVPRPPYGRAPASSPPRIGGTARRSGGGSPIRDLEAGHVPHLPALICDASPGVGAGHSYGAGVIGPPRCSDHDDLYPRVEPRTGRCKESFGHARGFIGVWLGDPPRRFAVRRRIRRRGIIRRA